TPFVLRPLIQRQQPDRLDMLDGISWTTHRPGREVVQETVRPHDVPKLLVDVFDNPVPREEADLLVTRLEKLNAE
ncbi:arylamine N-acetyltransferase, partial [Streptomyces sp. SB3404]|nr:arylamine N-acetyltransferase [Streptomyces boncukensis]